ncbi:MAG TPA: DinB family protein [Thermoanaerobaculia bacterium]
MKFDDAHRLHAKAVDDLLAVASRIPEERWKAPRAEGKWSPAETLEHLAISYDVLLGELETGVGMRVVTSAWQRLLLRVTMVPRILRHGAFPRGARAPREVRPQMPASEQPGAIAAFREKADRFASTVAGTRAARPGARLTHAYFGRSSLAHALAFTARHLEHHRRQLE